MEKDYQIIELSPENIADFGVCGYKDVKKHKELQNKINWYKSYYPKGLRIKVLLAPDNSYQGMLEYIPGEYAHRPVNAHGYIFIHCIFVGFKKEHKGKGYASALIDEALNEARKQNCKGVAVVTRKGSFMVNKDIFLKKDFEVLDKSKPDFELLAYKFDPNSESPGFKKEVFNNTERFQKDLSILRSPQCPYTEKNVNAMLETAKKKYKLSTELIDIDTAEMAQQTPSPFGTFCIVFKGEVVSHHPISNKHFENIIDKKLK